MSHISLVNILSCWQLQWTREIGSIHQTQPSRIFHLLELVWPDVAELILKEIKLKVTILPMGTYILDYSDLLVLVNWFIRSFVFDSHTLVSQGYPKVHSCNLCPLSRWCSTWMESELGGHSRIWRVWESCRITSHRSFEVQFSICVHHNLRWPSY